MNVSLVLSRLRPVWVVTAILLVMAVSLVRQYLTLNEIRRPSTPLFEKKQNQQSATQEKLPGLGVLAKQNILGNPKIQPQKKTEPVVTEIPITKLNFVLVGTIVESEGLSSALVQNSKKQTKRYFVGDVVESGVILESVAGDSVVLKRGTKLETLLYPIGDGVNASPVPVNSGATNKKTSVQKSEASKGLQSLRDRLQNQLEK